MCGVFGFVSEKSHSLNILFEGLKSLSYRGYDSVGVAFRSDQHIQVCKSVGRVEQFVETFPSPSQQTQMAIGHTRWATHGKPSYDNAHPHCDVGNTLALVHNGLIENSYELKQFLIQQGYCFRSETDSEMLAMLIAHFYNKGEDRSIQRAIRESLSYTEGSLGILLIHQDDGENLYIASRRSPIVVGKCENSYYISSDIPALISYTRDVFFLHDDEIGVLSSSRFELDLDSSRKIEFSKVDFSFKGVSRENYSHFMAKEIAEQPQTCQNTMDSLIDFDLQKFLLDTEYLSSLVQKVSRIVILGCGTSWHAALMAKHYIEHISGVFVSVEYSTEFRYGSFLVNEDVLVIAVSQSGETADTVEAVRECLKKKCPTLAVCNVAGSSLTRYVDHFLLTRTGYEVGVASTKVFTSQLILFFVLSIYIAYNRGSIDHDRSWYLLGLLKDVPQLIQSVLLSSDHIQVISKKYYEATNMLYLGRGLGFFIALEGALKMKEVSYIHAEGYHAGEMKHGPIALIDRNMPSIVLALKGRRYRKILNNISEIKAREGKVVALATQDDEVVRSLSDDVLFLPEMHSLISGIVAVVPLQLFSYYIAVLRGCDVDKPRNLAKSVTVE